MLLPPCMGQARPFHSNNSLALLGKVLTGSHKPTDARTAFEALLLSPVCRQLFWLELNG